MPKSKSKRSRYVPPAPKKPPPSPLWVPVLLSVLLLTGLLIILTNYLGLLPGEQENRYLLLGLAYVVGGFALATQYR